MKAVVHESYGPPEVLKIVEIEKPEVPDDGVLVRVHVSSVNIAEWYAMTGLFLARLAGGLLRPKDIRLGADFAGVVEAVGKGVSDFKPGDEVFGGRHGAWAEYVTANKGIAPKPANLTFEEAGDFTVENYGGRNFHFGVREHAMAAILNGMSHCKIRPYGSTFLIFSDYLRPAMRLSALMELPVIYVFTHDSIGVGEDGPTHQPVEQLASLRAIPGLITIRPADANEVVEAWRLIMELRHEPVALVLSRQPLPTLDRSKYAPASGLTKGAYILADTDDREPQLRLLGTGSEVSLCVQAYEHLKQEGIKARVVSMPSWELFEQQSPEYRESVLPSTVTARVSVEQASTLGWHQYMGPAGSAVGMKTFGASAPLKELQRKFGFTPESIIAACKEQLAKTAR